MDGALSFSLIVFLLGTFAAAFVTGLAGFAFGMVAAAIWLHALAPVQATTLIVAYALLVQGYAVWKLRHSINTARLMPFIIGSAVGIPVGIVALRWISATHLRTSVGVLLIHFSAYNLMRPRLLPSYLAQDRERPFQAIGYGAVKVKNCQLAVAHRRSLKGAAIRRQTAAFVMPLPLTAEAPVVALPTTQPLKGSLRR